MTGATGFVGAATLDLALSRGFVVNALTRRPQPARTGVRWISGGLKDADSLDMLVADADAVLHIAGVVNARDRQGFIDGNVMGTMFLVDAMRRGTVRRMIHVSSLSAREPELSTYGWSKELAERHVMAGALDWTIVRPPAIYGPGDREMLDLFRMATRGLMVLPPDGKLSVIEVHDLAHLLLALCEERTESIAHIYEIDDGTPGGWSHRDFAAAVGKAVGRNDVRTLAAPRWLLNMAARADGLARGQGAKLTTDRVSYFCHPDWVANPAMRVPPAIWQPVVRMPTGLANTVKAYRSKGWLKAAG
ncbi:MAG TPA: NAD(P)H-binding protein [Sphingobium sp.]